MKYKVIGWTYWENTEIKRGPISCAATQAIIDDIREHGYSFTGWDHQETMNCTPVLNDGKKRLYSQRGFGGVMAEAHEYYGVMDYALFAFRGDFSVNPEDDYREGMPPMELEFNPDTFVLEDISEHYTFEVKKEDFEIAKNDKKLVIYDSDKTRFIDMGDRVTLKCEQMIAEYKVQSVSKEKELSEEDRMAFYCDEEGSDEKWKNAKIIATICFE